MSDTMTDDPATLIAIAPCGHCHFVAVDLPQVRASNIEHIMDFLDHGYTVKRVPLTEAREVLHFCDCADDEFEATFKLPNEDETGA